MFRRIDESPLLNRLLQRVSTLLARQRGLPVVAGIALIITGFVLQLINLALNAPVVELIQVICQNGGILIALIGLLLAEPLGR
ncbi:MAG: hypothetical protein MUE40_08735 [Anaerolineae bacterium]|jgi:hypothetical protein|nr:hypothetical protein [Anaerolineae bacterium]